ncbi:MAG: hypothetical protein KC621_04380 [Myxococcales bacterium]|nr:hypothetical protein [Myxococcales bacterium]
MLLLLAACAPPGEVAPVDPRAGCERVEERLAADGTPILQGTRRWDDRGRPLEGHTTWWDDDGRWQLEERYAWGDEHAKGVSYRTSLDDTHGPWVHEHYLWRPDGLLQRYDRELESGGVTSWLGYGAYQYDPDGHLLQWIWDEGGDGQIEEQHDEQWSHEAFGWTVDEARVWGNSEPLWFAYRQHDEAGHELFVTEDWDDDGTSEVVRNSLWDGDHLVHLDVGGTAVVDWSCDWTFDGDDVVVEECHEPDAIYTTSWTWLAPSLEDSAEVIRTEAGIGELLETWTYDWTCPAGDSGGEAR